MKSERRHELQSNSLATALTNAPNFLRAHGSKILLAIIIVLLAAILLNQRARKNREQLQVGWTSVSNARMAIERLARFPAERIGNPADQAKLRAQLIDNANSSLSSIMASDDRQLAAEAYLLRGDLNWTLANMSEIPAAATQPSLRLEGSPADYLAKAEDDYQKVVKNYADQNFIATNARFGLAAVAENRGDWPTASSDYDAIKNDPSVLGAYKTLAEMRLGVLDTIKKPVYLAPATQPTTQPAVEGK